MINRAPVYCDICTYFYVTSLVYLQSVTLQQPIFKLRSIPQYLLLHFALIASSTGLPG